MSCLSKDSFLDVLLGVCAGKAARDKIRQKRDLDIFRGLPEPHDFGEQLKMSENCEVGVLIPSKSVVTGAQLDITFRYRRALYKNAAKVENTNTVLVDQLLVGASLALNPTELKVNLSGYHLLDSYVMFANNNKKGIATPAIMSHHAQGRAAATRNSRLTTVSPHKQAYGVSQPIQRALDDLEDESRTDRYKDQQFHDLAACVPDIISRASKLCPDVFGLKSTRHSQSEFVERRTSMLVDEVDDTNPDSTISMGSRHNTEQTSKSNNSRLPKPTKLCGAVPICVPGNVPSSYTPLEVVQSHLPAHLGAAMTAKNVFKLIQADALISVAVLYFEFQTEAYEAGEKATQPMVKTEKEKRDERAYKDLFEHTVRLGEIAAAQRQRKATRMAAQSVGKLNSADVNQRHIEISGNPAPAATEISIAMRTPAKLSIDKKILRIELRDATGGLRDCQRRLLAKQKYLNLPQNIKEKLRSLAQGYTVLDETQLAAKAKPAVVGDLSPGARQPLNGSNTKAQRMSSVKPTGKHFSRGDPKARRQQLLLPKIRESIVKETPDDAQNEWQDVATHSAVKKEKRVTKISFSQTVRKCNNETDADCAMISSGEVVDATSHLLIPPPVITRASFLGLVPRLPARLVLNSEGGQSPPPGLMTPSPEDIISRSDTSGFNPIQWYTGKYTGSPPLSLCGGLASPSSSMSTPGSDMEWEIAETNGVFQKRITNNERKTSLVFSSAPITNTVAGSPTTDESCSPNPSLLVSKISDLDIRERSDAKPRTARARPEEGRTESQRLEISKIAVRPMRSAQYEGELTKAFRAHAMIVNAAGDDSPCKATFST